MLHEDLGPEPQKSMKGMIGEALFYLDLGNFEHARDGMEVCRVRLEALELPATHALWIFLCKIEAGLALIDTLNLSTEAWFRVLETHHTPKTGG